jgi:hypothetical protein
MNGESGKPGEIMLLVYGILGSGYMGWWGYILIARPDLVERWRKAQPQWTQKLMSLSPPLPRFVEILWGIILLFFSLVFLVGFCFLLIRSVVRIGE